MKSYLSWTVTNSWLSRCVLRAAVRPHVDPGTLFAAVFIAVQCSHTWTVCRAVPNAFLRYPIYFVSITCPVLVYFKTSKKYQYRWTTQDETPWIPENKGYYRIKHYDTWKDTARIPTSPNCFNSSKKNPGITGLTWWRQVTSGVHEAVEHAVTQMFRTHSQYYFTFRRVNINL
jgi:hypothetical protein